jgi:cytidylate kinase
MNEKSSLARLGDVVEGLRRRIQVHSLAAGGTGRAAAIPALTIALSREAGAGGSAVARKVGEQLAWPVYDRELLQELAREMGLRVGLLEAVDERQDSWLRECLDSFMAAPTVSDSAYVRHLGQVLFSLAAHGECVVVGRGAVYILPAATTLRVRLFAPLAHRVAAARQRLGLSRADATRWVEKTDRERDGFVRDHFHKDAADPCHYDLLLNTARLCAEESAELIIAALRQMQVRLAAPAG